LGADVDVKYLARLLVSRFGLVNSTAPPGGGVTKIINVKTFAEASLLTEISLVFVLNDETNGGQMTAYFHNGQKLNWLPSIEV
jgi:hypothetical protein